MFHLQDLDGLLMIGMVWGARRGTGGTSGHRDVNVFENLFGSDAQDAIAGFDEVITFASAMLAAKVIDEAEA